MADVCLEALRWEPWLLRECVWVGSTLVARA